MSSPSPGTPTPPPPPVTPSSDSSTSTTTSPSSTPSEDTSTSSPPSTPDSHTSTSTSTPPPSPTPSTPSPPPSTPSTPTTTPISTPSQTKTFLTTSDGNVITLTTVVQSTPSPSDVVNTNTATKGFFGNTGAVAGTFSVVGLVGLGILIFVVTSVIRRRRADKFDKDVALAAAEAAATAHNPDFDDDYGYGSSGHGAGSYGYADTYNQEPVGFPPTREAYGMSDIGGTAYADVNNYNVGAGVGAGGGSGAAGIGAGVLYRSKSGKNQPDPYHAYAVHHDPTAQQPQVNSRYKNPVQGQWEDPGLVGGGYDIARNVSQPQPYLDGAVVRNKSLQSNNPDPSLSSHYSTDPLTHNPYAQPPPMPESYLDRYRTGADPENHQDQRRPPSMASTADIYGGVTPAIPSTRQPVAPHRPRNVDNLPNPFESQTSGDRRISGSSEYSEGPHFEHADSRMSLRDDEDYGAGRRVLKVANE